MKRDRVAVDVKRKHGGGSSCEGGGSKCAEGNGTHDIGCG